MNLFTKTLAATTVLTLAGTAMAADRTCSTNGNWDQTATWGGQSVPGVNDRVIIPSGKTVTVTDDHFARSIEVAGILVINDDQSLTLSSVGSSVHSFVSGVLRIDGGTLATSGSSTDYLEITDVGLLEMMGSAPTLTLNTAQALRVPVANDSLGPIVPSIAIYADATFSGSGTFVGGEDAVLIELNPVDDEDFEVPVTFTLSGAKMEGQFTMQKGAGPEDATFHNGGRVSANVSGGEIRFASNLLLDDDDASDFDYRWQALKPSGQATLQFDAPVSILAGDIDCTGRILLNGVNVATSGKINYIAGATVRFEGATGKTLTYSGGKLSGSCSGTIGATSVTNSTNPQDFNATCP